MKCFWASIKILKGLYIGYANFSLNSQSVSFLQAYLLLELISSALLAGRPAASVLWY